MSKPNRKTVLILVAVYAAACIFRYLLALATSAFPITIPDEFLYYSIARSLAAGDGALYCGQQANYSFFLYPLLLSIAYHFPEGTNFYRLMQIISILIMNLSVFPLYALGKSVLQDEKKSLAVSIIALLLPDFILGQGVLSESLIYPLFYLMLWLAYSGEERKLAFAGVVGGILFSIKPGQIVVPAVLIAFTAVSSMMSDRKKGIRQLIAGLVPLVISSTALLFLSLRVLNPGTTVFSIYDRQIGFVEELHIGAVLKAAVLSPYTFIMAAGVFPVLIPLIQVKNFRPEQRILLYSSLISAALLMLGTAWIVNRVENDDPTVHTRYIAMLFPVFLMLLIAIPDRLTAGKTDTVAAVIIAVCIVSVLIFRYDGGLLSKASLVFNYALCWLRSLSLSFPRSFFISILIAAALFGSFLICRKQKSVSLKNTAVAIFISFALVNNLCAYTNMIRTRISLEKKVEDCTATIKEAIGDENYVDVFGDIRARYDALLDVNTKDSKSLIYINDLYNRSLGSQGVYEPFIPEEIRGDIPDRLTDETELLLLDRDAMAHVGLSSEASIVKQTDLMTLIRIVPGKRWVDSMLGGPIGTKLSAETTAYFVSFDDNAHQTLAIDMTLPSDAKVIIGSESLGQYSFDLPQGKDTYRISISGDQKISFSCDCDIEIHSYSFTD